jgi:dolichol-phosphate mannosyltransferase
MTCCIIPAYKAASSVCDVVKAVLGFVDVVIVVDDACPQGSGAAVMAEFAENPRVIVIRRTTNGGVGAAVKTGLAKSLEFNPSVVIKIDADGQMDPTYIPSILACFEADPSLAYVKANRLVNASALRNMPKIRLFGNAILSLLAKAASGYWNILDPTNGYVAFNGRLLPELGWESFADSYFFEISVLCEFGLRQLPIGEIEMTTIYGNENSSLSIGRVLREFPAKIVGLFLRRILFQYFLFDVNPGSLFLILGSLLTLGGLSFGIAEWIQTILTHEVRSAGTIMLAALPFLLGVQLLLNALMYDVQFAPRTARELGKRAKDSRTTVSGGLA